MRLIVSSEEGTASPAPSALDGHPACLNLGKNRECMVEQASASAQKCFTFAGNGPVAYLSWVHPEDQKSYQEQWAQIVTQKLAHGTISEHRVQNAAGDYLWVREYISRAQGGADGYYESMLVDVTEQQKNYLELLHKEERLKLVLEGTRLGMWDWNPQSKEVIFDERWAGMLGHDVDELVFHVDTWAERVHPDDIDQTYADLQEHMDGKTSFYENVHRMRHKDGSWVYILDRGKVMEYDLEGNAIRFTGTHTDITPQKEAELRAQAAAKAKGRFLATMSHEIRTPLHGVLGMLELLQSTSLGPEQQDVLQVVQSSGESLLVIINDILDFSKAEEGKLTIEKQVFALKELLEDICLLFAERARAKELKLILKIDPSLPRWVRSDPHRLRQVLGNLISNAIKFTASGAVTLNAFPQGSLLAFNVEDTGKGIKAAEQIWDSFQQEDASITRRFGGTGLGLAIVRQMSRALGGDAILANTSAEGSSFQVTIEAPAAEAPQDKKLNPEMLEPLPKLSILVADDNSVNQLVIRGMLKRLGQECKVVDTGRQAVDAVQKDSYDAVFMDVHMAELDGMEATRMIRANEEATQPHIIALTADGFEERAQECFTAGMNDFVCKPFKMVDVYRALQPIKT